MDRIVFSDNREGKGKGKRKRKRNKEVAAYEGPDLISRLPDCVLGGIVTLLKPKEGARTAVLSRRWRHVWCSAPLNVDDRLKSVAFTYRRIQVISRILAAHPGPVRRFAIRTLDLAHNVHIYDDWFRLPMFDALQDLLLRFPFTRIHTELPASALRFASLRVLDLEHCSFPSGCGSLAFPCLIYLSLRHVGITEELFHRMISNSPGIETMVLDTNSGHRRLRLSLPRLRCLAISDVSFRGAKELEDLVIEDASSLERLLLHELDIGMSVRIIGATKLKMIGYLATIFPIIALNNLIFKSMVPVSLVEQFSTVKILALQMPAMPELKVVIAYLRCFPCLEKLKIKDHELLFCCFILLKLAKWFARGPNLFKRHRHRFTYMNKWTRSLEDAVHCDPSAPVKCLDHSLKTIVLQSYSGQKPHVDFAKFFVELGSSRS